MLRRPAVGPLTGENSEENAVDPDDTAGGNIDRVYVSDDVGAFDREELAGEGGEAFDVATLPLGIERVEGEARLARAAHAGQTDEPAARQPDGDVAEVVFAGTADNDRWDMHGRANTEESRGSAAVL